MEFSGAAKTDVGRRRTGNEDSFCLAPELGLFVVCDGMGGHAAGEVASRLAVETIHELVRQYQGGENIPLVGEPPPDSAQESHYLLSGIRMANRAIYDAAQGRAEYTGMGTTVVAVLALGERVALAHVGDSRIYRIRSGQIAQLSRDHSVVQMQLDKGIISSAEAVDSQYRHMITRALGLKESVEIDLVEEPAAAGDLFLLCSDGLTDLVRDPEILAAVREADGNLEAACQALVDLANAKGGEDNITALLVRAGTGTGGPGRPDRPVGDDTAVRPAQPQSRRGFFGRLRDLLGG